MSDLKIRLTEDQIEFYRENGFLAIDRITSPEEVQALALILDQLFSGNVELDQADRFDLTKSGNEKKERSPQLLFPSKYRPELKETVYWANATKIALQLLGLPETEAEALRFRDHSILKPPLEGAATPWHQDEAYWEEDKQYQDLTIWMPLQPATVEGGCMHFIPGSQKRGIVPHHHAGKIALEVDSEYVDEGKVVACPLPAGGATVHSCRTLHYASPNRSVQPRRTFIVTIGPQPVERNDSRDFYWNRGHRVY